MTISVNDSRLRLRLVVVVVVVVVDVVVGSSVVSNVDVAAVELQRVWKIDIVMHYCYNKLFPISILLIRPITAGSFVVVVVLVVGFRVGEPPPKGFTSTGGYTTLFTHSRNRWLK